MRFVYLDEAGIANIEHDPHVVVLGVMVDADVQWRRVRQHLRTLITKHIRPEHREGFHFHIRELRYGSKRIPRDSYSRDEQRAIIHDLCSIPKQFGLPLICAYVDRSVFAKQYPTEKHSELTVRAQVIAASSCAMMAERFIREATSPVDEETATMVFDNNSETQRLVKESLQYFKSQKAADVAAEMGGSAALRSLPLEAIADEPHFTKQDDGSLLQIADACAFATKRHLANQDTEGFFHLIKDNFFLGPSRVFGDVKT
jgi:hypothetical protein